MAKSTKELQAQIDELKAEKKAMQEDAKNQVSMKVGPKGGLSLYGLGSRFPTTLYKAQWATLLGLKSEIEEFLATNEVK